MYIDLFQEWAVAHVRVGCMSTWATCRVFIIIIIIIIIFYYFLFCYIYLFSFIYVFIIIFFVID